jgi:hypothetical protein
MTHDVPKKDNNQTTTVDNKKRKIMTSTRLSFNEAFSRYVAFTTTTTKEDKGEEEEEDFRGKKKEEENELYFLLMAYFLHCTGDLTTAQDKMMSLHYKNQQLWITKVMTHFNLQRFRQDFAPGDPNIYNILNQLLGKYNQQDSTWYWKSQVAFDLMQMMIHIMSEKPLADKIYHTNEIDQGREYDKLCIGVGVRPYHDYCLYSLSYILPYFTVSSFWNSIKVIDQNKEPAFKKVKVEL